MSNRRPWNIQETSPEHHEFRKPGEYISLPRFPWQYLALRSQSPCLPCHTKNRALGARRPERLETTQAAWSVIETCTSSANSASSPNGFSSAAFFSRAVLCACVSSSVICTRLAFPDDLPRRSPSRQRRLLSRLPSRSWSENTTLRAQCSRRLARPRPLVGSSCRDRGCRYSLA